MKKLFSFIMVVTMLMSVGIPTISAAESENTTSECSDRILNLDDESLSMISTDIIANVNAIVMDDKTYRQQNLLDMQEVLDNGTDIIVSTDKVDNLLADFQPEIQPESMNTGYVAGYYITSNGTNYNVSTIEYALMVEDGCEEEYDIDEATAYLKEIVANDPIDAALILSDAKK